jgi:signal transduction histidine kinase
VIKDSKLNAINLQFQVVILLIALVILSSLAVGLPAIWLLRDQLTQHAWDLVSQGNQTAQAQLSARQSELENLAGLTAQRPTLLSLIEQGKWEELAAYLEVFRAGAGLDLVMVCDQAGVSLAQAGQSAPEQVCQVPTTSHVFYSASGPSPHGLLLASQSITQADGSTTVVVVSQAVDSNFVNQLRQKTGMEQAFLYDGNYLAGSIPLDPSSLPGIESFKPEQPGKLDASSVNQAFELDNNQYFAVRAPVDGSLLETIVALPVSGILEAQQRLTLWMTVGLLAVALLCSLLGYFLVRRISAPLERLRDSAIALRKGDLITPVQAKTSVPEIAQVAYALEDARIALRHTMTELRQQKAWVDHLLESVVEGIVTLNRNGKITFFSKGAEQISGLNQDQVLGKSINTVFQVNDQQDYFSQDFPAADRRQEIVSVSVAERSVTLAITRAKLAPPEAVNAELALVLRDVTNEDAIRHLLGDFLANITHEFRTPLTAQAVSIELLLNQLDELSSAELRELLNAHYLGVLNLQTLIDNLLEGASIEAGRFRMFIQPTNLQEVIGEVVETLRPLMEKYDLRIRLDVPESLPPVNADPRRTNQVLVNLLSNAIKFGSKGTEILLSADLCESEVKVLVADRGPGISSQQKENLFRRFADNQSGSQRAEYGAGLGLYVVKTIVESQGGQVGVDDQPGGGTIFWFTIPVRQPQLQSTDEVEIQGEIQ